MILLHQCLRLSSLMLLIGWMFCIFFFSSQTADDSAAKSHTVSICIATIMVTHDCFDINSSKISSEQRQKILDFAENIHGKVRKIAHVTEYCLLGVLLVFNFVIWYKKSNYMLSLGIGILYAISDEFHQTFISGRACQISDVFLDSLGVMLGIAFSFCVQKLCRLRSAHALICLCCLILLGGCFTQQTRSTPILLDSVQVPAVATPPDPPKVPETPEGKTFQNPVQKGVVSSPFGMRFHPILCILREHRGIDIAAKEGTPVVASAPGKVISAGDSNNGYGMCVDIVHNPNVRTRYAHMTSAICVHKGDVVCCGSPIGFVGNSGLSTGPHLHFEVRVNGEAVDPKPLLADNRNAAALLKNTKQEQIRKRPRSETTAGSNLKNALMLFKNKEIFFF